MFNKKHGTELMIQILALSFVLFGIFYTYTVFHDEPLEEIVEKPLKMKSLSSVNNSSEQDVKEEDVKERYKNYWTVYGTKGDFTAGTSGTLFALAGFLFLLLSFKKQREANDVQLESFKYEKIEGRFFELIRLHRDNVSELSFTYYFRLPVSKDKIPTNDIEKDTIAHRKIFQVVKQQYTEVANELALLFEEAVKAEIYESEYLKLLNNNPTIKKREINLKELARADILYLIVFFGVGQDGQETILGITNAKYKTLFIKKVLAFAALKPKVQSDYYIQWETIMLMSNSRQKLNAILDCWSNPKSQKPRDITLSWAKRKGEQFKMFYPNNFEKYYGGHQFRLGHYFRHLYQTVSFINNQTELLGTEQKQYIRHLRGQLSTDEQIIFFLNSLSQLGRIWELEDTKSGNAVDVKKRMITDYELIKNIPNNNVIADLKLSTFYPNINYEGFNAGQ